MANAFHCLPVVLLNLSQAYTKVEMYEEALSKVDEFLYFDKHNFKANFREARARALIRDFDESLKILKMLKGKYPEYDKQVTEEIEMVKSL